MVDRDALPSGPKVALLGLRGAMLRLKDGGAGLVKGGGSAPIVIALSEALFWVGALDDEARRGDERAYWSQRDNEPYGRTVAGLLYARNFHTHELISTAAVNWEIGTATAFVTPPGKAPRPPGRGTLFSVQFVWEDLARLPLPALRERRSRDRLYDDHVASRPLSHPLDEAAAWFAELFP